MNSYSLRSLFKDEQRRAIEIIMQGSIEAAEALYKKIFEDNYLAMKFLRDVGTPTPRPLLVAADIMINSGIRRALSSQELNLEELGRLVEEALRFSITPDSDLIGLETSRRIDSELSMLQNIPADMERLEKTVRALRLMRQLPIKLDLWHSQNLTFRLGRTFYMGMKERSGRGDAEASRWVELYKQLCELLGMKTQD